MWILWVFIIELYATGRLQAASFEEKSGYSTGFDVVGRIEISNVASLPIESGYWQAHEQNGFGQGGPGYGGPDYGAQGPHYGYQANNGPVYNNGQGYGGALARGNGHNFVHSLSAYGNAGQTYQQPSSYVSTHNQGYEDKGKPVKHINSNSNKHNNDNGYDDDDRDDDGYGDEDMGYDDDKGNKKEHKPRKTQQKKKKPVIKPKVIIVKKLIPLSTTTSFPTGG